MNPSLHSIAQNWQAVAPLIAVPSNESQYQERLALLEQLLDEIGEDENHPLSSLLDTLSVVVSNYEQQNYPKPQASAQDVLAYLMAEHGLKQSDLPEIGSQGVVSEILRGKRELNKRQIQALSQRFHVSPEVFF
jgi:HTH-type transcriptional regulator/antitoxin HigA